MEPRSATNEGPDSSDSQALERTVGELTALYEVSRRLGATLDVDEVLETLLDSALALLRADAGYLVLGESPDTLFLRATRGVGKASARQRSSAAEWVLSHERPLVLNAADARSPVDAVTGGCSLVAVPLPSASSAIGAAVVTVREASRRFTSDDVRLLSTIANQAGMAIANAELYAQLQDVYLATVRSLAEAIDAKDPYTRGHSDRVATLALLAADRLGLSHADRLALELSAYLHDIGKIGIREDVLNKPGRLDDAEAAEMRSHPTIGATILAHVEFPWTITPNVRHHHEHWDGSGYPDRLAGDEIPLLARILSVADSHEAMVSDRPYRKGRSTEEALAELRRCAGTQFDAAVVDVFCEAVGGGPGIASAGRAARGRLNRRATGAREGLRVRFRYHSYLRLCWFGVLHYCTIMRGRSLAGAHPPHVRRKHRESHGRCRHQVRRHLRRQHRPHPRGRASGSSRASTRGTVWSRWSRPWAT